MVPVVDYNSLISILCSVGSAIFAGLLLRFPNRHAVHITLAATLFLFAITSPLRVLYWKTDLLIFNQLSFLGWSLLPLVAAVFVEHASNQRFTFFQKIFFLGGSFSFCFLALFPSIILAKPYLLSVLVYHLIVNIFYILLLRKGRRQSQNVKEKNIMVCLEISFAAIFGLAISDWLYKFGYTDFHFFPVGVSIFIFYLSGIIYSSGPFRWNQQTNKLFFFLLLSVILVFINNLSMGMMGSKWMLSCLTIFTLLILCYAITHQIRKAETSLITHSKELFDWEDHSIDVERFVKEMGKRPEFQTFSLIKSGYIEQNGCGPWMHCEDRRGIEVISREMISQKLKTTDASEKKINTYQCLLYIFDATNSDYLVKVPYSQDFLGIRFIKIVNPNLYSEFILNLANKVGLLQMKERGTL